MLQLLLLVNADGPPKAEDVPVEGTHYYDSGHPKMFVTANTRGWGSTTLASQKTFALNFGSLATHL